MKNNKRILKKRLGQMALACLFGGMMLTQATTASAQLLIMPIKVVFEDGERMESVAIFNNSHTAATYRISFLHQRQLEEGGYQQLEEPLNPKYDLSKMLVYSPRQVFLPGQAKQAVRLSARRMADLPDGEYRTHLLLQRISPVNPEKPAKDQRAVVGINVGLSVPVILRKGRYDTEVSFGEATYTAGSSDGKTPPTLDLWLKRTGKYSALGHVKVFWTPNGSNNEELVGTKNGVNIFHEIDRRKISINLTNRGISGGSFRLVFQSDEKDKQNVNAEKIVRVSDIRQPLAE